MRAQRFAKGRGDPGRGPDPALGYAAADVSRGSASLAARASMRSAM
jgi:hypothetical protein